MSLRRDYAIDLLALACLSVAGLVASLLVVAHHSTARAGESTQVAAAYVSTLSDQPDDAMQAGGTTQAELQRARESWVYSP